MSRLAKLALLKKAKPAVRGGEFICIAIQDVAEPCSPHADELKAYITEAIRTDDMRTQILEEWIKKHRPSLPTTHVAMTHYRVRYLNWMIKQLEKP